MGWVAHLRIAPGQQGFRLRSRGQLGRWVYRELGFGGGWEDRHGAAMARAGVAAGVGGVGSRRGAD